MRPVGRTSTRPRVGEPDGPAGTWRPLQAAEQMVELVGRRAQARDDLLAREAQSGDDAGVLVAEHVGARRGGGPGRVARGAEGGDQRALRVLQAVDEVRAARRGAREAREQRRRRIDHDGAGVLEQRGLVEAEGGTDRAPQAGHALAGAEAQDRRQQAVELLALRRRAEDVQSVADLQVLDLAQVAVDVLDERAEVLQRRLLGLLEVEVVVQLGLVQQRPDAPGQRRQLGRVERLAARVLVEQLLELGQLVVGLRAHHRRDEVVDDHRARAALGLHALAGVVDDEGVEERHAGKCGVGRALGAQPEPLAGQPLERAVLAEVDDRVGAEARAQPVVGGQVVVRGRERRVVVNGHRVLAEPARGLDGDEDVAELPVRRARGRRRRRTTRPAAGPTGRSPSRAATAAAWRTTPRTRPRAGARWRRRAARR